MVAPLQLPCTLFTNLLHDLADQISVTWDIQLDPDDLCLRYATLTGDVFELESLFSLIAALSSYRLEWCRRQDDGVNSFLFTDFTQPYIMRLMCHQKDPSTVLP